MNRRSFSLLALFGIGCEAPAKRVESEIQTCELHGKIDAGKMVMLPIRTEIRQERLLAPELFRIPTPGGQSRPLCLYCCASEIAEICSVRLRPVNDRGDA